MTPRFKFGDIIENGWASDSNPHKRGVYLRSFIRVGRMNPGKHAKLLHDDGTTGNYRMSEDDKLIVVGTIFDAKVAEAVAALEAENALLVEERDRLRKALGEWQPISTCPFREPVDLWCIYGGEEYAQYDGGASIGQLVSNRHRTEEWGFFGNQSNDGVPQRNAADLVPVAWRPAVKQCPAELIAKVRGIPLTLEEARSTLEATR